MNLRELKQSVSLGNKRRKRVGRGPGSGKGKTCGRGHGGAASRSGYKRRLYYEGGQMPLFRRLPKRGFSNARFKTTFVVLNVEDLNRFGSGAVVSPETLREAGLLKGKQSLLKVLGRGELKVPLQVSAHSFSKSALEKIHEAGGKATVIE